MTSDIDVSTPVLVMGGMQNALSIVRSLGKIGVKVSVTASPECWALHSKYCSEKYVCPSDVQPTEFWRKLLLSDGDALHGNVLITCSDDAIQFVAEHRDALSRVYITDESIPELQTALLDKKKTLELAQQADCEVPGYWNVSCLADLAGLEEEITYPIMIKPIHSHIFVRHYGGKKHLMASDIDDLSAKVSDVLAKGIEVMLCEKVPGPDSTLSSYYTYIDEQGHSLFHFTKKVIRRFPVNSGGASYHITEWDPETAEMGKRFFRGIGFKGLGNIEFKRDHRDGKLKVIECNPRFTAAQELLVQSGMDISLIVYCRLSGQPVPELTTYREQLRLLEPIRDYHAYRQLKANGEIRFYAWVRSLMHRQVFSCYRSDDLRPFLVQLRLMFARLLGRLKSGQGVLDKSLES